MESGVLTFKSGGIKVSSSQSRYDDDQWHFVLAAHTNQRLLLLIDDTDNFQYVAIILHKLIGLKINFNFLSKTLKYFNCKNWFI